MNGWLIAYLVGMALWAVIVGAALHKDPQDANWFVVIVSFALWPVVALMMLGAVLREYAK